MICNNCATGADVAARMIEHKSSIEGPNSWIARDMQSTVKFLHGVCKGCDCQHGWQEQLELGGYSLNGHEQKASS